MTCPLHPDRPATHEIEGRVVVCSDCAADAELRAHARAEWR